MTLKEEVIDEFMKYKPHLTPGGSLGSFVDAAIEVIDRRLGAMQERLAAREVDLARLRREMDALRSGLQYGIESTTAPHEVGKYLAEEIVKAGDAVTPQPKASATPHVCECGDCDQK